MSAVPVVRIGAVNGPTEYELSRVAYAARLSDGRIVVVDGGSSEVRWFSADGRFALRAGGAGEGPGELLWVTSGAVTPEDAVVLYDPQNQRLTWFGAEGSARRTLRMDLVGAVSLAPMDGGRLVVAEERPVVNLGGLEYNLTRDSVAVLVVDTLRAAVDTVLYAPGRDAVTWVSYVEGRPTATRQFGLPFGSATLVGAVADQVVMVEDGGLELVFLGLDGSRHRTVRRTDVMRGPLSLALKGEYEAGAAALAMARGVPERLARAGAAGLLGVVPEERSTSPFDRMLTDAVARRVWVRDYRQEWEAEESQRWTVHDATGRVLARITTPPGLEVMQVGPRHVVGVERDQVGVEYVVAYRVEGSELPGGR
ncbi:MAG: 6-bladed beta-propeller [Gemmatimonadota bacterium]